MHLPASPTTPPRRERLARSRALIALLAVLAFVATACGSKSDSAADSVALDKPVSSDVPSGTTLTIGDPVTQVALETSGLLDKIPFHVKFANLSGGPQTMEAFRGHALDLASVADIPPIFANWTGLKSHIVAA
jgi:sulfonate transport system substrate-binding protein